MKREQLILLREEARKVRKFLERAAQTEPIFREFPTGACGNASELLGHWLESRGVKDIWYVKGQRPDVPSHAWLEIGDVVIDLTLDQFSGCENIYMGQRTKFHESCEVSKSALHVMSSYLNRIYNVSDH